MPLFEPTRAHRGRAACWQMKSKDPNPMMTDVQKYESILHASRWLMDWSSKEVFSILKRGQTWIVLTWLFVVWRRDVAEETRAKPREWSIKRTLKDGWYSTTYTLWRLSRCWFCRWFNYWVAEKGLVLLDFCGVFLRPLSLFQECNPWLAESREIGVIYGSPHQPFLVESERITTRNDGDVRS